MGSLTRRLRRKSGHHLIKLLFRRLEPVSAESAQERVNLLKIFETLRLKAKKGVGPFWKQLLAYRNSYYRDLKWAKENQPDKLPQADQLVELVDNILFLREAEGEILLEQAAQAKKKEVEAGFRPNLSSSQSV